MADQKPEQDLSFKTEDILSTKAYEDKNFFSRTTETLKQDRQKAVLIITLAVVVFAIIVAGITALIFALNPPEAEIVEPPPVTTTKTSDSDATEVDAPITNCKVTNYQSSIQELTALINQQAEHLLVQNPDNPTVVADCLSSFTNNALDDGYVRLAYSLFLIERDFLVKHQLNSVAFASLDQTDFSRFDELSQYHLYVAMIDLAKSINNTEAEQKYIALMNSVKHVYDASANAYIETDETKPGYFGDDL